MSESNELLVVIFVITKNNIHIISIYIIEFKQLGGGSLDQLSF